MNRLLAFYYRLRRTDCASVPRPTSTPNPCLTDLPPDQLFHFTVTTVQPWQVWRAAGHDRPQLIRSSFDGTVEELRQHATEVSLRPDVHYARIWLYPDAGFGPRMSLWRDGRQHGCSCVEGR